MNKDEIIKVILEKAIPIFGKKTLNQLSKYCKSKFGKEDIWNLDTQKLSDLMEWIKQKEVKEFVRVPKGWVKVKGKGIYRGDYGKDVGTYLWRAILNVNDIYRLYVYLVGEYKGRKFIVKSGEVKRLV